MWAVSRRRQGPPLSSNPHVYRTSSFHAFYPSVQCNARCADDPNGKHACTIQKQTRGWPSQMGDAVLIRVGRSGGGGRRENGTLHHAREIRLLAQHVEVYTHQQQSRGVASEFARSARCRISMQIYKPEPTVEVVLLEVVEPLLLLLLPTLPLSLRRRARFRRSRPRPGTGVCC